MPAPPAESPLVPPRFLFRFRTEVRPHKPIWSAAGVKLGEEHRLPDLGQLDGERTFADVRMAWAPEGIAWQATVTGKHQLPWCRESRLEDSDGLQVWVDTRATHNVHRATRFCHRFAFLPRGGGRSAEDAVADQVLINRARENARPIRPREITAKSSVKKTGYTLSAFVSAQALGGYDPQQQRSIGFTYALLDRELGLQTLSNGPHLPYEEDPSCWITLELVEG
ncbi:MAG: hypothetical protein AAGA92_08280 [Planctomycetota bacterium]